jgi:hypothetical protein
MSTPAEEIIALELISRLENITVFNGYAFNVESVSRVNRDSTEWTPRDRAIVVSQDATQRNEEADRPGNPAAIGYTVGFQIFGFRRQSDRAATADAAKVNEMHAAIKKAVANDTDWHQFNRTSYDANWGPTTPFNSPDGRHAGLSVELTVHFRVDEDDPFTVRV